MVQYARSRSSSGADRAGDCRGDADAARHEQRRRPRPQTFPKRLQHSMVAERDVSRDRSFGCSWVPPPAWASSRRALLGGAASAAPSRGGALMTLAKSRFSSRLSARRRLSEPVGPGVGRLVRHQRGPGIHAWPGRPCGGHILAGRADGFRRSARRPVAAAATAARSGPLGQTSAPAMWASHAKRSARQDQKADLGHGQLVHRHGGAGGAGKREHVGARRPDPQCIAQERRNHGDQDDGGDDQHGISGRPYADRHRHGKGDRNHGEMHGAVQIGTVAAVKCGEGADGRHQSGRDVAGTPAGQHRHAHAKGGARGERPAPAGPAQLEQCSQPEGRRWWGRRYRSRFEPHSSFSP